MKKIGVFLTKWEVGLQGWFFWKNIEEAYSELTASITADSHTCLKNGSRAHQISAGISRLFYQGFIFLNVFTMGNLLLVFQLAFVSELPMP